MTKLDFYILSDNTDDLGRFVCRLTEKIYKSGHHCYIQTADAQHCEQLDKLLWVFRDRSFIPHTVHQPGSTAVESVVIGHNNPPDDYADVLINLSDQVPDTFSRFARVVEIVGLDDQHKQLARSRYKFYKDRGYAIESHQL